MEASVNVLVERPVKHAGVCFALLALLIND